MTNRSAYTYTVLRYCHDTTTGEFLNVGVALYCRDRKFVGGLFGAAKDRLNALFPRMHVWPAEAVVESIALWFAQHQVAGPDDIASSVTVIDFARRALPSDDGSLHWSPMGSGITLAPQETLRELYQRFVGLADGVSPDLRSDIQVWNTFRDQFQHHQILTRLRDITIRADSEEVKFEHAWKNGRWHCFLPVSFQLPSAGEIKDKAYRILGRLTSVRTSCDPLKVYFLVGEPQTASLRAAALAAQSILMRSTFDAEIVLETEAATFAQRMASDMNVGALKRTGWRN
jgi:hypothetical protein